MDNNLFDDLVASIKEAGTIKRNEVQASRGPRDFASIYRKTL